ncbi:3'-5' exonuclease [Mucilaginibacter myungsuensis]|uniref:3'-5' exonuclease n=1 Tax=Mucilaginibacter myungsuensis TaxID=649104 RepID=A0A929PWV4_9SPHI|nr:3'-5' exonuclease [Mucilaginibacter myungsuensis]MBE9663228.1 3'-5' exonuclease [Mucilaginibacter myungsuensis]MDN3598861.1 3'-5' exonuclease [Mucilaginibacter myungsuensis]
MLEQLDLLNLMVLDIETVPQYATHDELPQHMQKLWDAKTQHQRKEVSSAEFYERAGIWAEFGKIVCISVGVFTKDIPTGFRVKSFAGHDERELLVKFALMLKDRSRNLVLCAHNGKEFDFPYICRRMLIHGIKLPEQLEIAGKKPWEINHIDTMELWKFGDYKSYTSLSLLTAIFDIPTPKDDIDGSQVGDVYWKDDQLERICTYCQKDVVATAQLLRRFRGQDLIGDDNITIVE